MTWLDSELADLVMYMKDLPFESKYDQEHVYKTVFQMSSHSQ